MSRENSAMQCYVRALWGARESACGRIDAEAVTTWGRMMADAVHADVRASDAYSPESDGRVLWAREVLAEARRREPVCRARGELEATIEFLLGIGGERGPCGKELAAGEK